MRRITEAEICVEFKRFHAYLDKISYDFQTDNPEPKPKYKLAVAHLASVCIFHEITTSRQRLNDSESVCVLKEEWLNRALNELTSASYVGVTFVEQMSHGEIIEKVQDPENEFPLVAQMPDHKILEFRAKKENILNIKHKYDAEVVDALLKEIDLEAASSEVLNKLGL